MNAKEIYDILRAGGLSRAGALGMLGNMMAESSLIPNIAQRGMTKLTDEQYTAAADNGLLDFANDSVGYGLCQWTYNTRKRALLDFARQSGTSVGDGKMQCVFCLHELQIDYPSLYKTLCESNSIDECADLICAQYERPAVNNFSVRRGFAHTFEQDIPDTADAPALPTGFTVGGEDWKIALIQFVMQWDGYWGTPDGIKSPEFLSRLHEYVDDMAKC